MLPVAVIKPPVPMLPMLALPDTFKPVIYDSPDSTILVALD